MSAVVSKLLKKSFEIIEEASRGGDNMRLSSKTSEIMDILKDHKETLRNLEIKKKRDSQKMMATMEAPQPRGAERQSLHKYFDPFEDVISKKQSQKPRRNISEKPPRQMMKSAEKFNTHEIDYGEQQKILQKQKNTKIVKGMLWLGGILAVLIVLGMNT